MMKNEISAYVGFILCLLSSAHAQSPHFVVTKINNTTGHELTATVYDEHVMGEASHSVTIKRGITEGSLKNPVLDLNGRSIFAVKKEINATSFYAGKPVSFRIVNLSPRKGKHNQMLLVCTLTETNENKWTAEIKLVTNGSQQDTTVLHEWEEEFDAVFGDDTYEIKLVIFLDNNKLINGTFKVNRISRK